MRKVSEVVEENVLGMLKESGRLFLWEKKGRIKRFVLKWSGGLY